MEINQVKTIQDAVDYFREHPLDAQPDPEMVMTLTADYTGKPQDGVLRWDIWRRDYTRNERYSFIDGQPKLMLYEQKKVDDQLFSSGIVFALDLQDTIRQVVVTSDSLTISVNKNAFFWHYDRNQGAAVQSLFSQYAPANFVIGDVLTPQMDSQTPSHNDTGLVDPGDD